MIERDAGLDCHEVAHPAISSGATNILEPHHAP
jgi:hypothetical protein